VQVKPMAASGIAPSLSQFAGCSRSTFHNAAP
jgi:hypothetical protein